MGLHKDLTGNDLHVNKIHADTHSNGGSDSLGLGFNVKAYGAVGDGTHDDTTAIQAAIDAAHALGAGTVLFPKGSYLVTGTLFLYTGISIIGRNKYPASAGNPEEYSAIETKIMFSPTTEMDLFDLVANTSINGYVGNVHISGLYLLGNTVDGATNSRYAIFSNAHGSVFENLGIAYFQDGIYCNFTMTNKYRDIYMFCCSHACIYTSTANNTSDIFDNVIMRQSPWGAILRYATYFRFTNCLFESLTMGGVNIYQECTMLMFNDTYCEAVPSSHDGDNYGLFYIGHDGVVAVKQGSTIIDGLIAAGGFAYFGSCIDVGHTNAMQQVSVRDAFISRYVNGIKADAVDTMDSSITLENVLIDTVVDNPYVGTTGKIVGIDASQLKVSFLTGAPLSVSDVGHIGEVRILPDGIYVCSGTPVEINGEFETDVAGWSSPDGATITRTTDSPLVGTGSLKMVSASNAAYALTDTVTLIVNHTYLFSGLVKSTATTGRKVFCKNGATFVLSPGVDCSVSAQTLFQIFTATGVANYLLFGFDGYTAGDYFKLDHVVCYDLSVPVWTKAALVSF